MSAHAMPRQNRIVFSVSLLLVAVSLCYSQFGIIALGEGTGIALNVTLFLIPVALGMVMLGPLYGVALAVVTGACVAFRAQWTPTTLYDFELADPFLSLLSIVMGSLVMAAIVEPAARRWPPNVTGNTTALRRLGRPRIISLVAGCTCLSLVYSYVSHGLVYLLAAPIAGNVATAPAMTSYLAALSSPSTVVEVLLNAALLGGLCILAAAYLAHSQSGMWRSDLTATFHRWLALVMILVSMLSSSFLFCVETVRHAEYADALFMGDLEYLQEQVSDRVRNGESVDSVASGYTTAFNGTVAVVRDKVVVSSNDPTLVGEPVGTMLGPKVANDYDRLLGLFCNHMVTGARDTGQYYGVRAIVDDEYTYFEGAPLDDMFTSRTATLRYNALFLAVMLAVVFAMVHQLLHAIVVLPIHRTNDTLGLITAGELTRRVNERDVREFDSLSNGINTTVAALKKNTDEVIRRSAQDMATAKQIQESALPREFPPFPNIDRFDLYASMRPAREVGGDFYDFFLLDDSRLAFLVADVSGKGIPAAMFMMTAKTQVRTHILAGLPLEEAVSLANHHICLENDARMFVTMYVCVLNYTTGQLVYVNAGHNPPVYSHGGTCEWVTDISALPLGIIDGVHYERFERTLEEGDLLYLYSDGVNEAMDADGQQFGDDRLMQTIVAHTSLNARSVCGAMRQAVTEFTEGAEQSDDITMLALRYGVPPERRAYMELSAHVGQLVHAQKFVHEELHRRNAPRQVLNALDIAIEELFCNVCRHAYPNATPEAPGEVRIEYEYHERPSAIEVTISDDGVPFNPLDESNDIGLGIRMARGHVTKMDYERAGNSNVVRLLKQW